MPKPKSKEDTEDIVEEKEEEEVIEDNEEDEDEENEEDDEEENLENEIENEDDLLDSDDEIETDKNEIIVSKEERMTRPFLTKYERVRVIGTRRKQLYLGAKPMIKIDGKLSIEEIVDLELKEKVIPFKVKRYLPNSKKVEIWSLSELEY
jgi:DNA-directed RNA polymerase I, II, and III subunit RPABC2